MTDALSDAAHRARTLYLIGNAHIDPVWLWRWQDGLAEVRATLASALDRMEEYEDFVFTCDSVAYLAWAEQVDPALFARIRARVAEGRFEVVGGWWIEPDCNVPSGESFVRQALYAQRFLQDRFGRIATVGCNVDPFGHNATLPQLLRKSGIDAYLFLRPEPHEKTLPAQLFWWGAPDGSRVLAYRIPHGYCSPGSALDEFIGHALERADADAEELMVLYGVGNHGGGPTRANIDSIKRLEAEDNDLHLVMSGPRRYFDAMAGRANVPHYVGDLQHHAVGCYSAHSGIKAWNRRAECELGAAERFAVIAERLAGVAYPAARLEEAWRMVLFNQFHDTLAGTAIASAYDDARDQYGYARAVAASVTNLSLQAVAAHVAIAAAPDSVPVFVANPHPWAVRADVEFELEALSKVPLDATAEDTGEAAALQRITSEATLGGRHRRLVLATELPPLGYRVYRLTTRAGAAPEDAPAPARHAVGEDLVLENDALRVVLDPGSGWLTSFVDKRRGVDLLDGTAVPHAVVLDDPSDTWSHGLVSYDKEIGRFAPVALRRLESGPVRQVIEVESAFGESRLTERLILGARADHLEVRARLDWRERRRVLKLRFPLALEEPTAVFSIPYGQLERPANGSEEAAQAWVAVHGRDAQGRTVGWALLNDAKHGFDVDGAEIGMTAARSPVYAWHDPHELDPSAHYDHLDQGIQDFAYALLPHDGATTAAIARLADELNSRPIAVPDSFHAGELPPTQAHATDGGGAVVMSVLKRAEDGGATIVRAYDAGGSGASATFALPLLERTVSTTFAPGEVKTFLVPDDPGAPVREVSLLEWSIDAPGAR